jgi:hypothetical protein
LLLFLLRLPRLLPLMSEELTGHMLDPRAEPLGGQVARFAAVIDCCCCGGCRCGTNF